LHIVDNDKLIYNHYYSNIW